MAPRFFDLTWIPTRAVPELPTDRTGAKDHPYLGDAVYRGEPYTIVLVPPPELVGATVTAQIRRERLKANAAVSDPLADFAVDTDVDDNIVLTLTAAQAAALPDQWYWDIQEWDGDDPLDTWLTGKGKAWGDITRAAVA